MYLNEFLPLVIVFNVLELNHVFPFEAAFMIMMYGARTNNEMFKGQ